MDQRIARNFVLVMICAVILFVLQGNDPADVTLGRLLGGLAFAALAAYLIYLRHDRRRR